MSLRRGVAVVAALAVAGALGWVGISALSDATQTREDVLIAGTGTQVELAVDARRFQGGVDDAAASLWASCRFVLPVGHTAGPVTGADGRYQVIVTPAIESYGEERLVGCLQDMTLPRVSGTVTGFRGLPAAS